MVPDPGYSLLNNQNSIVTAHTGRNSEAPMIQAGAVGDGFGVSRGGVLEQVLGSTGEL